MNGSPAPIIRPESECDAASIRVVLEAAFSSPVEADLVELLRAAGDIILGLVAETPAGFAGYAAFSRLALDTGGGTVPATGLAPLGVRPDLQSRGIGSALIRAGLEQLKDRGETLVCVVGDPAYYNRFGFAVSPRLKSPYAGPYFQALSLSPTAPTSGTVSYPKPFAALG